MCHSVNETADGGHLCRSCESMLSRSSILKVLAHYLTQLPISLMVKFNIFYVFLFISAKLWGEKSHCPYFTMTPLPFEETKDANYFCIICEGQMLSTYTRLNTFFFWFLLTGCLPFICDSFNGCRRL